MCQIIDDFLSPRKIKSETGMTRFEMPRWEGSIQDDILNLRCNGIPASKYALNSAKPNSKFSHVKPNAQNLRKYAHFLMD